MSEQAAVRGNWTAFATVAMGAWLIAFPISFSEISMGILWSDIISGILLIALGIYALRSSEWWIPWAQSLVGVWLQFAPLLFWAPKAVSYINDTLVGVIVIALAILLRPNPIEEAVPGGGIPAGWSYNPSSWWQRIPIIALGFLAWMFARAMAAYQLGYLDAIWDPIFGDGTEKVITSNLSKQFPVPDAGLGAMAYTIETLMGAHGSPRRWHTIPWFVVLFAILVVPLGLVSITLVILQPIIVGHWCTWCLLTAVCMLFMIALAIDEVVAVLHYLYSQGKGWKAVFWKGGDAPGSSEDDKTPPLTSGVSAAWPAMVRGVSIPWNLCFTALLGLWMMFAPSMLDMSKGLADGNHIFGAVVVAISVIAMAEVVRAGRYINVLIALWPLGSCWFSSGLAFWTQLAVGLALVVLSLPRGPIREKYGEWDRFIV